MQVPLIKCTGLNDSEGTSEGAARTIAGPELNENNTGQSTVGISVTPIGDFLAANNMKKEGKASTKHGFYYTPGYPWKEESPPYRCYVAIVKPCPNLTKGEDANSVIFTPKLVKRIAATYI